MANNNKIEHPVLLKAGIAAGAIAGVVMSIFMLVMNVVKGVDVWMGMKGAGAPFLGEAAMQPGFEFVPVVVGVASHMFVSIGWGVVFALIASRISRSALVLAGVPFGIVVWLVMYYLVLPVFGLGGMVEQVPVATAILEHVLFGVAVAVAFLPFHKRAPQLRTRTATAQPTA